MNKLFLACKTNLKGYFTKGKVYEVIKETKFDYRVINDKGESHVLTKKPDEDGFSYKNWFCEKLL